MTRNVSAKITAPELFAGQTDDAILTRRLADCHVHVTPPVPLKKKCGVGSICVDDSKQCTSKCGIDHATYF